MEQEWQVRVVAIGVPFPSDEQFRALHRRLGGAVKHEPGDRLMMVWRVKAPDIWQATEAASVSADSAMKLDLGDCGTLRQLHVVHADDVEADRKEILAALGIVED